MGQARKRVRQAVHDEAGGQQIGIEGLAIEAYEELPSFDPFSEVQKRCPFLGVIPGEELLRDEAVSLEPAQADEKGHRSRAAREPGRFRVEKERPAVIQRSQGRIVRQNGEPSHIEWREIPDAPLSVPV